MTKQPSSSKRPGRPKTTTPAIRRQITMPPAVFKMLEALRGNTPRSTYIQGLIYSRALHTKTVAGEFIANGVVRGPMDERTDEVCLGAYGEWVHDQASMPPHKPRNQDLQCRCVIVPVEEKK